MWSSHLKFEHAQQAQDGGAFNAFREHHQQQHQLSQNNNNMPSTPTHHRRGQSLSALNAPRTPNTHALRPPVYLQSPMSANPSGLMGVGDMFSPPSGSFQENMGYYSPGIASPTTALDNLNEEIANFDLAGFGGPLSNDGLFESPMPSPGQAPPFPFHNHNPFTAPPENFIPPRTASPMAPSMPEHHPTRMDSFIRTPQPSPTRHPLRDSIISTPDLSPTHHNPLKESLLQARQPSPSRESYMESLIRTPEPSPTRNSFSRPNLMHTAPDLRPALTPRGGSRSPDRSRQSPSPTRRMRAHQRTQSLASVNSVMSLADGDMEQYRVESNVKPEQISELIGETDAPTNEPSSDAGTPASSGSQGQNPAASTDGNKKFICKWLEPSKEPGEADKPCGQFFERKENCKAHIQTHLDDRQYKCPYGFCGKLFVRSHDLRRHLRTHDVHKKWVCPCGRDFSRADALHRHQGRGNCIGAPPGTKRKEPAKRGRPPKKKDLVVPGGEGGGDSNNGNSGAPTGPGSIQPADLNKPPEPQPDSGGGHGNSAAFITMGGGSGDGYSPHHHSNGGFDEDMGGMCDLGMPDFATDPSPSPPRDGLTPSSGVLAPSPLEEELCSSSPMPPGDQLLEPTGDEWLEDLIFINDDNFVDTGSS